MSVSDFPGIDREQCGLRSKVIVTNLRKCGNPERTSTTVGRVELKYSSGCRKVANGVREIRKARSMKNVAIALTRRNTAGSKPLVVGCGPSDSSPLLTLGHTRKRCEPCMIKQKAVGDAYAQPDYVVFGEGAKSERMEQGVKNVGSIPTATVSRSQSGASHKCVRVRLTHPETKGSDWPRPELWDRGARGVTGDSISELRGAVCNSWRTSTSCGVRRRADRSWPMWKREQDTSRPERMASQLLQEKDSLVGVPVASRWKGRGGSVLTTPAIFAQLWRTFQHRSLVGESEPQTARAENEERVLAHAIPKTQHEEAALARTSGIPRTSCPFRRGQTATGTAESLIDTGAW